MSGDCSKESEWQEGIQQHSVREDSTLQANYLPYPLSKWATWHPTVLKEITVFSEEASIPRRSFTTLAGCFHFGLFSQLLEEKSSLLVCRLNLPTSGLMHSCPISPVTTIFEMVWKSWIPSDILEILLICWHSPSCPGGNCETFWKAHLSSEPRVWEPRTEETNGKLQKKGFCLTLKQTTSEKKSMNIPQYADGFLPPVLAQIDPVAYKAMGPDDSVLTSQPICCGSGQLGGPLVSTAVNTGSVRHYSIPKQRL